MAGTAGRLERARLDNRRSAQVAAEEVLQVCEGKLAKIDEGGIEEARLDRSAAQAAMTAKVDEARDLQAEVENRRQELADLKPKYAELLKADAKLEVFTRRLRVASDMRDVVEGALQHLQRDYVGMVSARMNELFLDMVGADPVTTEGAKSGTIFSAEISPTFEIVVHSGGRQNSKS